MKKILVFYASYGGGHLGAAKSIKEYISNNYKDIDVEIVDCMKYVNKAVEKVTAAAYNEAAKRAPWVWGKIYDQAQSGTLAHISSRSNKILAIKLLKLLRNKKPDLIISTHPFGSQMCSYLKRKNKIQSKIATIMTDFAPHDQWLIGSDYTDYYFVAHDKMKQYLICKDIPSEKIHSTGIPLSNKFFKNYNKNEIFKELNLDENKKTILFFGGGEFGLGKSRTYEIFTSLVQYAYSMQVVAIAGKNKKMKETFEEIVENNKAKDYVKILGYTDKIPQLMNISDLVITKPGGMTTTESLASNLPMLIINPIPGQEEENAEFLEEKGIAIWIKKEDNPFPIIRDLFNNENKLNEMKNNTKLLAHPDSTKNICEILLSKTN